ncbi:DNAse I-like superfamily protein [Prunus dulcis]|uniref:DNAse I-like superfamily protein n=1 Tax=Prunus dulcis TaxID=3755 RepID=A0A5H2XQK0_PRUDU|nr:DNAse I-like superfamily protein [Prunus dulcis]
MRLPRWSKPMAESLLLEPPLLGGRGPYITGDSHIRSVRDANLGFRQGDAGTGPFPNQTGFRQHPPPPFQHNHHFRQSRPLDPNQPYRPNQQFRPPQQFLPPQQFQPPQQFRPRPKPLDYRNWEFAKTTPSPTCDRFTVLSYNILADSLAHEHRSKLYFHIPYHMMDWQWRKKNLIFELGLWSADIMCFQEVDKFQDIEEELKLKGYNGIWKIKEHELCSRNEGFEEIGKRIASILGCGLAIQLMAVQFFGDPQGRLIHEECIEFSKLGLRDNVAQICVLESMCQTKNLAVLPRSSTGSNKIVICNIHVLYNPKRGEIKLGQSPLYNFISEQKLDLSGVDRDKVTGQASAQIYAARAQPGNHFVQGTSVVDGREGGMKPSDSTLDIQNQNLNNLESSLENVPLTNNLSQPQPTNTLNWFDKSCTNVDSQKVDGAQDVEVNKESKQNAVAVESAFHVAGDGLKDDASTSYSEGGFPVAKLTDPEHAFSHVTEIGYKEKVDFTSTSNHGLPNYVDPLQSEIPLSKLSDQTSIADAIEVSSLGNLGNLSSKPISCVENDSRSVPEQVDISCAPTSVDLELQKNLENLSLTELDEAIPEGGNTAEDVNTFISALHNTEDAFPSDFSVSPNSALSVSSTNAVEDGLSPGLDSETVYAERTPYDPALWTPMEIEAATGNSECTLLEHPLKLRSTYTEVEDCAGARDSNGEPLVTSYNRCFLGTVDYIWRSEGLQTVRVLAPIPKHAMQWTSGFPTKKWGSDHIALASELAFVNSFDQS